jgi:hypothetical protein
MRCHSGEALAGAVQARRNRAPFRMVVSGASGVEAMLPNPLPIAPPAICCKPSANLLNMVSKVTNVAWKPDRPSCKPLMAFPTPRIAS